MPYIEEGGSVPKMPKIKSFITLDRELIQEDIIAQVKEMKRLADLKAEKEKADELSITKISYRVISSSNDATMKIKRGNDPLNVVVHNKFRLKTLGFTKKLGVPPLPKLSTFGISVDDRKRKRSSEILQEVFVKETIVVDGMHRNLTPPPGIEGRRCQVIRKPEARIFYYNGNFDLVFQRESEFYLTSAGIEGLAECKASASNLRRIQVKDIIKEVKDHLKTYSSAGMDISWYVEGIRCGSKESQMWQYTDYSITICRRTS
ncbi:hypothetical protein Tco_0866298 [Tanacetum coccineum]